MREINFRFWDTQFKVMVNWEDIKENWLMECFETQLCHVAMQYTGLKDKNGKEIYEGDIIKSQEFYPSVVKYDDDYAQFEAGGVNFLDASNHTLEWEVIGNIYENPDLLEEK